MSAAHRAIDLLAERGMAICAIAMEADLPSLAAGHKVMNILLLWPRQTQEPASFIADVRTRHGLSQREFADTLVE